MKNKSILILGGGASGLAAAVQAGQMGARVTILERSDRVGKKLLATGNGRCNLANMDEPCYFGDTDFARRVLQSMPVADVLGFFDSLGLPTRADASGRVYPACNQAAAVLDVLRLHLERVHARVITGAQAQAILRAGVLRRAGCAQAGRCKRLRPADGAGLQAGGSCSGAGSH